MTIRVMFNLNERKRIYNKVGKELGRWKEFFYYELEDLIKKDKIFFKLPRELKNRESVGLFDVFFDIFKNMFLFIFLVLGKIIINRVIKKRYINGNTIITTIEGLKTESFDYLFVINTKDHIISVIPLLECLDKHRKVLIVTFIDNYLRYKQDFDNFKNCRILFFEYELFNFSLKKYINIFNESNEKFKSLMTFPVKNMDLRRLLIIDKYFIKFYLKIELIQYYFFKKIFELFNFRGVIGIVFTTAFIVAKEKKIPTFILQHGIGGRDHEQPYACDYFFAIDDVSKEDLERWLDYTVVVLATGSPRFDYLNKIAPSIRNKKVISKKLGVLNDMRIITYVSQGHPSLETDKMLYALKKLIGKLPNDTILIVKLHPRENRRIFDFRKHLKSILDRDEVSRVKFIKNEVDIYELIANSELILSNTSTSMIEAIAMNVPVIQINFTGEKYLPQYDLSTFGWRPPICNADELVAEVLKILNDSDYKENFIKEQEKLRNRAIKNFGKCGEVISDIILRICEKG